MTNRARRRRLSAALLVAGCTVGPAYHTPPAPVPTAASYREAKSGEGAWKVANPSDAMLRGKWWHVFREPELDALEDRLNINNQTIKQSFESYMAARAQIRGARAQYFPTVTASPSVTLSRSSGATRVGSAGIGSAGGGVTGTGTTTTTTSGSGGSRVTFYTAPVEASWAPDLFGRVRNTVRQFQYAAQVSAADLENQRLLEQATLAQTYFEIRGQDAMENLLAATVEADQQLVALARSRFETGIDTELSVAQAEQALQTAIVQAINARLVRAQFEHAIATLLGVPATTFTIPKRALLAAPPPIPTGAPSQLLERRPDIAAAERLMAQANATIGIGYAAYFPTITLSGTAGFTSTALGQLFEWSSRAWSIGTAISETLFDAGLRRATIDQSVALYNANVASYRQIVLTAFQQVEDFLAQTRILSEEIAHQRQLVTFAQRAFELEKVRYETGVDPYLNLMTQQLTLLTAQQTLVTLQVQAMTSAVSLIEALGGGWDRSSLPTPSEVSKTPPASARRLQR
ncbi:MAG: efflux system, outer rane lipoprotein NodT family [Myxococcales bacterium]|nr:efflux system, outer rane lipoprotein NodT family [Myxococcales bacterium]